MSLLLNWELCKVTLFNGSNKILLLLLFPRRDRVCNQFCLFACVFVSSLAFTVFKISFGLMVDTKISSR